MPNADEVGLEHGVREPVRHTVRELERREAGTASAAAVAPGHACVGAAVVELLAHHERRESDGQQQHQCGHSHVIGPTRALP